MKFPPIDVIREALHAVVDEVAEAIIRKDTWPKTFLDIFIRIAAAAASTNGDQSPRPTDPGKSKTKE